VSSRTSLNAVLKKKNPIIAPAWNETACSLVSILTELSTVSKGTKEKFNSSRKGNSYNTVYLTFFFFFFFRLFTLHSQIIDV